MQEIKDIVLSDCNSASDLINSFSATGFQATNLSEAVTVIEKMKKEKSTVFLAFTANLAASGLRGIIAELCEKKFIDALITTAGSIDHDRHQRRRHFGNSVGKWAGKLAHKRRGGEGYPPPASFVSPTKPGSSFDH